MNRCLLAVLVGAFFPSLVEATLILNVSGPTSPTGVVPGANSFTNVDNTNINGTGTSVNTVTLNVAINNTYAFNTPFEWVFAAVDNNAASQQGSEYFVTVNFTNNGFAPVGPAQFDLVTTGGIFNAGTNVTFDTNGAGAFDPTPAAAGYTFIGAHTPARIVFGGLNGSGGAVAPFGGTTSYAFSIDVADIIPVGGPGGVASGNFNLVMRVNPEPGSLLLGLSSVGLLGGVLYRRRKAAVLAA